MVIIELLNEFLKVYYDSIPKKEERITVDKSTKVLKISDCEDMSKFFQVFLGRN